MSSAPTTNAEPAPHWSARGTGHHDILAQIAERALEQDRRRAESEELYRDLGWVPR